MGSESEAEIRLCGRGSLRHDGRNHSPQRERTAKTCGCWLSCFDLIAAIAL